MTSDKNPNTMNCTTISSMKNPKRLNSNKPRLSL